ncbi:MAG TPA: sensor histidine kinase [Candidatus Limnocylindrales bacterium]
MRRLPRIQLRAVLPICIAVVAVVASVGFQFSPAPDNGLRLAYVDGQVEVASVEYGSAAYQSDIPSRMQPGAVVSNLDRLYVLGLSDQAKQDLVASGGSWTYVTTLSRADADAEQATFTQLVKAARSSDIPWLSDPVNHPRPAAWCAAGDTGCLHGAPIKWEYVNPDDGTQGVCVPTIGGAIVDDLPQEAVNAGTFCTGKPQTTYSYLESKYDRTGYFLLPYQTPDPAPVVFGLIILVLGWLAIRRGWVGSTLRPYALSLPLATAMPLLARPIDNYPSELAVLAGSLLVTLAMLPLAIDFLGRVDGKLRRRLVGLIVAGLAIGSAVAGWLRPQSDGWWNGQAPGQIPGGVLHPTVQIAAVLVLLVLPLMLLPRRILSLNLRQRSVVALIAIGLSLFLASNSDRLQDYMSISELRLLRAFLAGGVAFIPGLLAARSVNRRSERPRALVSSADVALAAMTPGIAAICLVHTSASLLWPIWVWLILVWIVRRFLLRPLGTAATSAQRQRDLVVAATEAERIRIAADIHDEALQDLTMLIRRLDSAGDKANADAARDIAERLRAICGDLRLPVLDDLGVGPALEWLCGRLGTASIALDRAGDESRLPADVELAVFRIAQEALSNAVRHGEPPVVVRYRAEADRVELTVEDNGSGIPAGAAELAERTGHMGLMNMAQRADAVGASLQIGRRPEGGTRVALTWERATEPGGAPTLAPA